MTQEYKIVTGCIPTVTVEDEEKDVSAPRTYGTTDGYFEKRIGRISGGPPPRGKPKPPPQANPSPEAVSKATEALKSLHRAVAISNRRK